MKIGILTFHYSNNYGALLQTYALSKTLYSLGYEPIIINRVPKKEKERNPFGLNIKKKIVQKANHYFQKSFDKFRKKFLQNITSIINRNEDLGSIVNNMDAVIVGSDQVWRIEYTKGLGLNNFLDFVPGNIRKIAYAASFGNDNFEGNEEIIIKVKALLHRFNAISVREKSGVAICKDLFDVSAVHLIDPTLLLAPNDYIQLISKKENHITEKFITRYILDDTKQKSDIIEYISKQKNLNIFNITRESTTEFSIRKFELNWKKYYYPTISTWLFGIKNAEFIISDSYHGVVFSILFNKQFICIGNKYRGLTRINSLLEKFGLENRLINESENFPVFNKLEEIDYAPINEIIELERIKSIDFLNKQLN